MNKISETIDLLQGHYKVERRTALNRMREEEKPDPYKILIGCLVSINIKDDVTDKILAELFGRADNFEKLLEIPDEELEEILYLARYRRVKAARLKEVSREILDRFGGNVPDKEEELMSIKGIGPKTCNVVLNFAFGQNKIPVDSNTVRIANRLGWIESEKHSEVEELLVDSLDSDRLRGANAVFMLHGKNVCVPVSPFCSKCPVSEMCEKEGIDNFR